MQYNSHVLVPLEGSFWHCKAFCSSYKRQRAIWCSLVAAVCSEQPGPHTSRVLCQESPPKYSGTSKLAQGIGGKQSGARKELGGREMGKQWGGEERRSGLGKKVVSIGGAHDNILNSFSTSIALVPCRCVSGIELVWVDLAGQHWLTPEQGNKCFLRPRRLPNAKTPLQNSAGALLPVVHCCAGS